MVAGNLGKSAVPSLLEKVGNDAEREFRVGRFVPFN